MSFLSDTEHTTLDILDYSFDCMFGLDMIMAFFSAYYDNNLNLIIDRKVGVGSLTVRR